ncbi:hypothetical protein [Pseudalkalibacillus hwajinpoensis]|uniref:hypothetical protein n=1 Tax=Guptibacillus hwajinpoensis TaxID=208199 RepID=UPI001CD6C3E0|nr:hypothetical protein [Pseudalkalibacillus hwajinpoensis]MCA0990015.1 hypothetical protein [Pseudalkalibacillus hwajinpoensis]
MNAFSYKEYCDIISRLNQQHEIIDFSEVTEKSNHFAIIRHDVEFSVERAFKLAELEKSLGIKTSYLFQTRNNAYNLFSTKNINLIREINKMDHKIGIHVHLGMLSCISKIREYISNDIEIMESLLEIPIDRYSFHRPSKKILREKLNIDGKINTYDSLFFDLKESEQGFDNVRVKYYSDSRHGWEYGYPDLDGLKKYSKIQLLTHPYSWTSVGYKNSDNFTSLKREKVQILNETFKEECNHFPL